MQSPSLDYISLPLRDLLNPIAIDFDVLEERVYWTDVNKKTINRASLDGIWQEEILSANVDIPDGLALDIDGRKLYWTDTGRNTIERANLDGSVRELIVWQSLDEPRAIVVDKENEHLYWSDWGSAPKIERSNLDGRNRETLVSTDLGWPNGLTLDKTDGKLYWCDGQTERIEYLVLHSNVRRVLISFGQGLAHTFSLSVVGDYIYWTDWTQNRLQRADKATGKNITSVGYAIFNRANDVHYFEMPTFTVVRCPVDFFGGTIDHDCTNTKGSSCNYKCNAYYRAVYGGTLLCQEDGQWHVDTSTICELDIPNDDFFLVADSQGTIFYISMTLPQMNYVKLPLGNVHNPVALDFDLEENKVYWTDVAQKTISRASFDGTEYDVILSVDIEVPDGLALDLLTRKLYWTDTGTNRIERANLDGSNRQVVISTNITEPRAIIVDNLNNYIFWTDWGIFPKIERANLDGSSRQTLIDTELGWPNGLVLDKEEQKLYWCDALLNRIEYYDLIQNARQLMVTFTEPVHPFSLAIVGDYVYWTDWTHSQLRRANKRSGQDISSVGNAIFYRANDLHFYTRTPTTGLTTVASTTPTTSTKRATDKPVTTIKSTTATTVRLTTSHDTVRAQTSRSRSMPSTTMGLWTSKSVSTTATTVVTTHDLTTARGTQSFQTPSGRLNTSGQQTSQKYSEITSHHVHQDTTQQNGRGNVSPTVTALPVTSDPTTLIKTTIGLTTVASTTPTTSTKRATDKPVTTIKSTTATTVRLTTSHDTVRAQTSRSRSMPSTTMGLWTSKSVSTTATTVVTTHDLTTARGTQSFQTPSGRLNTSGQQTSQKYSEITSHHVHQDTTQQNGRGNVSPTVTALPVTSDPTTLIKTTIDPGPSFTKCPENEIFEFQVGAEVNYAVIDNITIEAVNGKGDPIDYTISDNVQIPGHMEFQVLPIHVTVLASAGEKQAYCRFTIKTIDKHPPRIKCPSSKSITTRQSSEEVYWNDPIVTDNVEARLQWTSREIGSTFPVGNTSVTASAIDSSGNMADCSFWVNILHNQGTCDDLFPQNGGLVCGQNTLALFECILYCQSGYKPSPNIVVFTCFDGDWIPPNEYPGCAKIRTPASISIQVKFTYEGVCEKSEDIIIMVVEKLMEEIDHHDLCSVHGARVCNSENLRWHCGTGRKRLAGDDLVLEFRVETTANLTNYGDLPNQGVDVATTTEEMERTLNESIAKFEEFVKGGNFSVDVNGTIYDVDTESFTVGKLVKTCLLGHANTPFGCLACAIGTFYNSSINECLPCDVNTYQDSEAQLGCKKCEDGQYTERAGSYTRYQCLEKPEENPTKSGGLQALYLVVICVSAALIFVIVLASVTCLACRRKPKPRSRNLII
ncbi:uncharacterized protein [Ptychodera flava]|uniref:uncharacterized protein n=1 Tax=Ptychodera flava TaxID=63121 RepID=UPI00396A5D79